MNVISSTIKKKNLFVFNTQFLPGKAILTKRRGRSIYLLSKNLQIRLWYRQLGHASNARIVEASKFTDKIDITINKDQ